MTKITENDIKIWAIINEAIGAEIPPFGRKDNKVMRKEIYP
jgi:hypothetical protein